MLIRERRFSSLCNLQSRRGRNLWQETMLSFLRVSGKLPGVDTSFGHSCMNNSVRKLRLCRRLGMTLRIFQSKITNNFQVRGSQRQSSLRERYNLRALSYIQDSKWQVVLCNRNGVKICAVPDSMSCKLLGIGLVINILRESQLLSKNKWSSSGYWCSVSTLEGNSNFLQIQIYMKPCQARW